MSELERSPSCKLSGQQKRRHKADVYQSASSGSTTEEGDLNLVSTPTRSCGESTFSSKGKNKRSSNRKVVSLKRPVHFERGDAKEIYDVETVLREIESSLITKGTLASEESTCTCSCYEANFEEGNGTYSDGCQNSYIEQVKFEREEMTSIVKQSEDHMSTVKPWINYHFTAPCNSVTGDFVSYIGTNCKKSTVTEENDSLPWHGGDNFENDVSTDDETFFSCTQNSDTRDSNYSISILKEKDLNANSEEYLEMCDSDETVRLDKERTSLELVSNSSYCYSSKCVPPVSFTKNHAILEVSGSRKSQHPLTTAPLAPTSAVKLTSFQINRTSTAMEINTTTASSTCTTLTDCIARPLALLPSRTSLTSVSIVSIVSCSQSSNRPNAIKEIPCDASFSSLHSESLIPMEQYRRTRSLLGDIMGSDCNSIVAAFLKGIPLSDYTQSNGDFKNLAIAKSASQLYDVHDDDLPNDQHEEDDNLSVEYPQPVINEQKAVVYNPIATPNSSRINYSMESIPIFKNIHSKRPVSKNSLFDLDSTRSSSSTPMYESTYSGSQPQIHTSCGKTFLPPEFSDIEDSDDYPSQCKYTLVRKTIFSPTRKRFLPHEHPFFSITSDTPTISESTSKVSMTTPVSSFDSTSTLELGGGRSNIHGSRSVLQVFCNPHLRKVNVPTSISCDSMKGNSQLQPCNKLCIETGLSPNTKKPVRKITSASRGCIKCQQLDYNCQKERTKSMTKDCSIQSDSGLVLSSVPPVPQDVAKAKAAATNHLTSKFPPPPIPSTVIANERKTSLRYNSEGCATMLKPTVHKTLQQDAPNQEAKSSKKLKSKVKKAVFRLFRSQNL